MTATASAHGWDVMFGTRAGAAYAAPARAPPGACGMTTPSGGLAADTYGWDTVFAIRVDDVNAAITRLATSPKTFSASTADPGTHLPVTVTGDFSDWQITLGGSGKLLDMTHAGHVPGRVGHAAERGARHLHLRPRQVRDPGRVGVHPACRPAGGATGTFHNLVVKAKGEAPAEQVVTVLGGYNFGNSTDDSHLTFDAGPTTSSRRCRTGSTSTWATSSTSSPPSTSTARPTRGSSRGCCRRTPVTPTSTVTPWRRASSGSCA